MTRRLSTALVVALVLMMVMSVAVFAQGQTGDAPYAPQDGTGYRFGATANDQPGVGRIADGAEQGANFANRNGDGVCDNFVDADGNGTCDTYDAQGGQKMGQRNGGSQSNSAAGVGARRGGNRSEDRGGSRRNGVGPQAGGTLGGGHGRNR